MSSSQETSEWAGTENAQEIPDNFAAAPASTTQAGPGERDLEAELEAALNLWFEENDAAEAAQQLTPATAESPSLEVSESTDQVSILQAALDYANATLQTEREARAMDDVVTAGGVYERDERIRGLERQVGGLEDQLASSGKDVNQLWEELQIEKRLKDDAEQQANAVRLQLSTVDQLLEQRNKDIACLRNEIQRLVLESSSGALQIAADMNAWAQERQESTRQVETLEATISELRDGDDLRKKIEAARSEGYETGGQDTRQLAEVKHQEVMAAFIEQLTDANSRAERAEKTAKESVRCQEITSKAAVRTSTSEVQHAEQLSWYQKQLDDANRLTAHTNTDKLRAIKISSLREEVHAKLEARFKTAQDQLGLAAKRRKAQEQAEAKLARLKDGQIASLKFDLERERSESEETKLDIDKFEVRLAVQRSDNQRQVAELTARIELEKGKKKAEVKARTELVELNRAAGKAQRELVVKLTAQLAAERARHGSVPVLYKVEHSSGLFALALFLAVVVLLALFFLGAGSFTATVPYDMRPCGIGGEFFTLCKN